MPSSIAELSLGIVADDRTEKGAKSAEKRLAKVGNTVGQHNRAIARETERSIGQSGKSILGMMSRVEKGVTSALGGKSLTAGLAGRLGSVGEAGSAMAGGLAGAATSSGILAGAATGVTVAVGGTIAALGAAAYAAFKFSDSWAKGAASLSRTAEVIGVSTKALTEFNAAAERVGVDKGTATGAMGSLSQTLNDARYGRNTQALEVMRRLGVGMKTNADGTVNTEAMLPAIADALQRQNSSGRRTAAGALGIPLAALPAFTQGGKALSGDMRDADGTAVVIDDRVGNMARGVARKGVLAGQAFDRTLDYAGRSAAGLMGGKADDAIVGGMRDFDSAVHGDFKPAVSDFKGAVGSLVGALGSSSGTSAAKVGLSREAIAAAQNAQRKYGIPASITLAQYGQESSFGRSMPRGSNNPFGIKAVGDEPFVLSPTHEERGGQRVKVLGKFRKFGSLDEAFDAHARLLTHKQYARARSAHSVDGFADALTGVYASDSHYGEHLRGMIHGKHLDQYDHSPVPVKVDIQVNQHGRVTGAKATGGRGTKPSVSYAMSEPGG